MQCCYIYVDQLLLLSRDVISGVSDLHSHRNKFNFIASTDSTKMEPSEVQALATVFNTSIL